jgi:hypothetical protein
MPCTLLFALESAQPSVGCITADQLASLVWCTLKYSPATLHNCGQLCLQQVTIRNPAQASWLMPTNKCFIQVLARCITCCGCSEIGRRINGVFWPIANFEFPRFLHYYRASLVKLCAPLQLLCHFKVYACSRNCY